MNLQAHSTTQQSSSDGMAVQLVGIECPFCHFDIDDVGEVDAKGNGPIVVCPRCQRRIHLTRYFWVNRGINIDTRRAIRCPNCFKLFAEGDFSDRPQRIKCRDCGRFSVFQRVS